MNEIKIFWEIVIAILMFGVLIFIHEFGHFITARLCGVGIKEFAIGMGPKLFSVRSKKNGTVYALRLLPIGGFVSMVGEDEESDEENALNKKPVWQRMIITAAGAALNILLGVILTFIIVSMQSGFGTTTISRFADGATSCAEGKLQVGDTIVKVGSKNTDIPYELIYAIMHEGIEPVDVTVIRNGEKKVIEDVVFPTSVSEGVVFGDYDFSVEPAEKNLGTILKYSWHQTGASIRMIWESLFDLITGRYGVEQMSGPVGVTSAIGDAVETGGGYSLLSLIALITLNLGIFNLLPIPALDGGRLFFQLIELIRRKPIKPEYEGVIHLVGLVLMMALMLFVTYKDIMKLIIK